MAKKNLTMEQFVAEVVADMEQRFPNAEVSTKEVTKNNGRVLTALLINEGNNITPSIYLNAYYEVGDMSVKDACDAIEKAYNRNKMDSDMDFSWVMDFDKVSNKIVFNLVNTERNASLLATIPHVDYLDLAYIFKIMVGDMVDNGTATITITNNIAESWGKSAEELMEIAKANQYKLCGENKVQNMTDLIYEMEGKPMGMSRDEFVTMVGEMPMAVVTNEKMLYGCYVGFDKNVLADLSENCNNLAILPSSIHECIVVPYEKLGISLEELKDMPMSVNATEVAPEEVLSDNVYVYDVNTREISIVE